MINQDHVDFARDVVALARRRGVNNVTLKFNLSSSANFIKGVYGYGFVTANWHEGRHGDNGKIQFESTDSVSLDEREANTSFASSPGSPVSSGKQAIPNKPPQPAKIEDYDA